MRCMFRLLVVPVLGLTACSLHAQTVTESILHNFCSTAGCADGATPESGMVLAGDGNFYGTTYVGGANNLGSVYKMTPSGTVTTLYSFSSTGGQNPQGGLVEGTDGNLYGTTYTDSVSSSGTVFQITLAGALTVLYTFTGTPDGKHPQGALIEGTDGYLYGTTHGGGANTDGTVFKIAKGVGTVNILHSFDKTDGNSPMGSLVQAANGFLYGMTEDGGANSKGNIFKISTDGTTFYDMYDMGATTTDAEEPYGNLVIGPDGNYYGVTYNGGANSDGTFFEFVEAQGGTSGTETVLYSFQGGTADGKSQQAGIILGSDGNFYGTSSKDGANDDGAVFKVTSTGTETVLYSFAGGTTDGTTPLGNLVQGNDGNFSSTLSTGGADTHGAVFKIAISPALASPVVLTLGSASVTVGHQVSLTWAVSNAYGETMGQCFATSNDSEWSGAKAVSGSVTLTPATVGTNTYGLTCGGTESGFATLTVNKYSSNTALVVSPSPASIGQPGTLTATVTGSNGTPTGSVTFYYGTDALSSPVGLVSGVANLPASTNGLPPGTYPLTATYSGSSTYGSSTSPTFNEVLNPAPTTTTLNVSATTVTPPAGDTFTATVKRSASGAIGTPTGTVVFYYQTLEIGTAPLNGSGVATFAASSNEVPPGSYGITAKYNGDSSDTTSTSSPVTVTVE